MGFNIGSVLSGLGIPNINLGNIGKEILTEGKKLLGEVVKDSFTLSNQPGQTFASKMNLDIGGKNVNLPNPIGALANKLLGSADGELNKFGVNVDFKKVLEELFHLPMAKGGNVTVPSVKHRAAHGGLPKSPTAATSAKPYANVTSGLGSGGGGGGSSGGVTAGGVTASPNAVAASIPGGTNEEGGFEQAATSLGGGIDSLEQQIMDTAKAASDPNNKNSGEAQAQLTILEGRLSRMNEMFSLISQIMQDEHQTRMGIISNIK